MSVLCSASHLALLAQKRLPWAWGIGLNVLPHIDEDNAEQVCQRPEVTSSQPPWEAGGGEVTCPGLPSWEVPGVRLELGSSWLPGQQCPVHWATSYKLQWRNQGED